jgi:hypothetical protein
MKVLKPNPKIHLPATYSFQYSCILGEVFYCFKTFIIVAWITIILERIQRIRGIYNGNGVHETEQAGQKHIFFFFRNNKKQEEQNMPDAVFICLALFCRSGNKSSGVADAYRQ